MVFDRVLSGPYPTLPRPVDWCSERWSALPPRGRVTLTLAFLVALGFGVDARVTSAATQWGGQPRTALIATTDLPVGAEATGLREVHLPPAAVPPRAVGKVPPGSRLAMALPEGAVLTSSHLDARGPAAGLEWGLRAVPIAAQEGWGIVAGGWVDVWVLGDGMGATSELVASSRPVVEVHADTAGTTALVGLSAGEVAATTQALSIGGVLLTHAPPPAPDGR